MKEVNDELQKLQEKLAGLQKRQETFQEEILELKRQVDEYRMSNDYSTSELPPETTDGREAAQTNDAAQQQANDAAQQQAIDAAQQQANDAAQQQTNDGREAAQPIDADQQQAFDLFQVSPPSKEKVPLYRQNLEKFIGENLLNKIGVVITVIGAGIGVKYAIDHELIGFWTRIILGYLLGAGMFGFALKLKKNYLNFSAVLFSGAMAICYFMTFAAFSFYSLIPMTLAFILMVLFTVLTVAGALYYNRQVVAIIGLVGAYAVPFLVSTEAGDVKILFSYISIINAGILVIAFLKYWKYMYYTAFLFTWAIFVFWYSESYETSQYFTLAWVFLTVFFVSFYIILLASKLLKKEKFEGDDIVLLLLNSSLFYGYGIALLHGHLQGLEYKGWFTVGNAVIHFSAGIIAKRMKSLDQGLLSFITGLVITFITLAIPVQFGRNWVSMLWALEAAVLFHAGRVKQLQVYEILSYPLMILAFFGLISSWPGLYHTYGEWPEGVKILPLINANFPASLIFILSFSWILKLMIAHPPAGSMAEKKMLSAAIRIIAISMLLIISFFSLFIEIATYWNQVTYLAGEDLVAMRTLSEISYSFVFLSIMGIVNQQRIRSSLLGLINLGFDIAAAGLFLTFGLIAMGDLRTSFLSEGDQVQAYHGIMFILVRYLSFLFFGLMIWSVRNYVKAEFTGVDLKKEYDIFLHLCLLTIAGNELIHWMDFSGSEDSYKLGLSILCGVYSLLLIILGIWKKKLHLRISAIVLFSLTLLKLFFYDLSSLSTIAKTVVFIILGILLLIISFLYAKYRTLLFGDDGETKN